MKNALFSVTLIAWSGCALAQHYLITDLGTFQGGNASYAHAINDNGDVAGGAYILYQNGTVNASSPFYYDGALVDLGSFGGAFGINDSSQIVGFVSTSPTGIYHAFLYDGAMHDLGTLPGDTFSVASGINAIGQVAGYSYGQHAHAFLYYDGTMQALGYLPGDTDSVAFGINRMGVVVGESYHFVTGANNTAFYPGHAFLYDGTMHDLGTLPNDNVSVATGINDSGEVVGSSNMAQPGQSFPGHAFLYDGTIHDLGTLPGDTGSVADGINDSGSIVGISYSNGNGAGPHAFLYADGTMYDLNNRVIESGTGWTDLDEATAINDSGEIAGWGIHDNNVRAFLLTPISVALASLLKEVTSVGPGSSLADKVMFAQTYYAVPDFQSTCAELRALTHEAQAQGGKKISQSLDAKIIADTGDIEAAIGCK